MKTSQNLTVNNLLTLHKKKIPFFKYRITEADLHSAIFNMAESWQISSYNEFKNKMTDIINSGLGTYPKKKLYPEYIDIYKYLNLSEKELLDFSNNYTPFLYYRIYFKAYNINRFNSIDELNLLAKKIPNLVRDMSSDLYHSHLTVDVSNEVLFHLLAFELNKKINCFTMKTCLETLKEKGIALSLLPQKLHTIINNFKADSEAKDKILDKKYKKARIKKENDINIALKNKDIKKLEEYYGYNCDSSKQKEVLSVIIWYYLNS